jgi:hypothetical protein
MEGKTKVLPNNDGGFDQGVAGVIIERTAGNVFELLVANSLWLLDLFAHIRIWLVGWVGGSAADLNRYGREDECLTQR